MTLGEKIKKLRTENKFTQETLAEKLFVTRTAISKWERDAGYPNIDSLKSIAEIFKITIDELLSSDELILIAKEEKKSALNNYINISFLILDFLAVLFIFLPIYSQREGSLIKSVNLLNLIDTSIWIKIVYFSLISLILICAGVQLLFFYVNKSKLKLIQIVSLGFFSLFLLFLVITLEPYAASLSLIIVAIKLVLLFKKKQI